MKQYGCMYRLSRTINASVCIDVDRAVQSVTLIIVESVVGIRRQVGTVIRSISIKMVNGATLLEDGLTLGIACKQFTVFAFYVSGGANQQTPVLDRLASPSVNHHKTHLVVGLLLTHHEQVCYIKQAALGLGCWQRLIFQHIDTFGKRTNGYRVFEFLVGSMTRVTTYLCHFWHQCQTPFQLVIVIVDIQLFVASQVGLIYT